jgi:5-methylcytosine-specific restriction endonuclease McrA
MRKMKRKNKPRLRHTQHTQEDFRRLYDEYGGICVICGDTVSFEEITKDHIVPRSRGGSDYISNIQPACSECNERKSRQARDYRPHVPFWAAAKKNKGGRVVRDDRDIPEE